MELWSFSQNSLQILISFLALGANEKLLQSKVANYFWSNTDALIFNCRAKKSYWSVSEKTFFSTEFNHGMKCPYKPQGGQSVHPFGKYITLFPLPGKQVVRCSISASWVTGFLAEFIAEMAKQRISPSGINWDWLMGDILIGDTSPAERQFPSKQFVKTQPLVTHIHTHTFTPTPTHTPPPVTLTYSVPRIQSTLNPEMRYCHSHGHSGGETCTEQQKLQLPPQRKLAFKTWALVGIELLLKGVQLWSFFNNDLFFFFLTWSWFV